jgi:hypothetical protein
MGKKRIAYRVLLGETLGGILRRPRSRWENNTVEPVHECPGSRTIQFTSKKPLG